MSTRTPARVLFWSVAVVSLLWNSIGIADYTMTQLNVEAYLAGFTDEQIAHFEAYPAPMVAAWAIAVWFAFLGSILLLFRLKLAFPVFAISFGSMIVSMTHSVFLAPLPGATTPDYILPGVIVVIAGFLLWFSHRQSKRGVLA